MQSEQQQIRSPQQPFAVSAPKKDLKEEKKQGFLAASNDDPLKKREQFAVTLRKQKTREIVAKKRQRLMKNMADRTTNMQMNSAVNADIGQPEYEGYYKFNLENQ